MDLVGTTGDTRTVSSLNEKPSSFQVSAFIMSDIALWSMVATPWVPVTVQGLSVNASAPSRSPSWIACQ